MRWLIRLLAPEYPNTGVFSSRSRSESVVRADRTGPMTAALSHWKIANSRVRPPSTVSSKTMSARSMPACGRAMSTLSIFTASAGRSRFSSFVGGLPVSGQAGGGAGAIVAVGEGVVALGDGAAVGLLSSWPPQAARTSSDAVASAANDARKAVRGMTPTVRRPSACLSNDPPERARTSTPRSGADVVRGGARLVDRADLAGRGDDHPLHAVVVAADDHLEPTAEASDLLQLRAGNGRGERFGRIRAVRPVAHDRGLGVGAFRGVARAAHVEAERGQVGGDLGREAVALCRIEDRHRDAARRDRDLPALALLRRADRLVEGEVPEE